MLGDVPVQCIVTVTIEPDGAGASLMMIEHELLPPALASQHAAGWMAIAGQLAAQLAGAGRTPAAG